MALRLKARRLKTRSSCERRANRSIVDLQRPCPLRGAAIRRERQGGWPHKPFLRRTQCPPKGAAAATNQISTGSPVGWQACYKDRATRPPANTLCNLRGIIGQDLVKFADGNCGRGRRGDGGIGNSCGEAAGGIAAGDAWLRPCARLRRSRPAHAPRCRRGCTRSPPADVRSSSSAVAEQRPAVSVHRKGAAVEASSASS